MAAIARFGTRMVPEREQIIRECRQKGQLVEGPHIAAFEEEFARFLGGGHVSAVSTEYGRIGLYFILKALDLPAGSEIIVPALTFWVVPEITRVAGLTPVFVDIDPTTFTMSPEAAERAITPNTRAILPTHLYGMACDLDPILALAKRHNLKVVEDCAHSLGAQYKGRMVGTDGDASFFSFQAFKPLNTFGGGLTWVRDADVARRVRVFADAEEWPSDKRVERILRSGYLQYTFIRPKVFTWSLFPVWWAASWTDWKPEQRLWEDVRRLHPFPPHYRGRFSNVQAAIGRAGLARMPEFIERTRRHARRFNELLGDVPGVTVALFDDDLDALPHFLQHGMHVAREFGLGHAHSHDVLDHTSDAPQFEHRDRQGVMRGAKRDVTRKCHVAIPASQIIEIAQHFRAKLTRWWRESVSRRFVRFAE